MHTLSNIPFTYSLEMPADWPETESTLHGCLSSAMDFHLVGGERLGVGAWKSHNSSTGSPVAPNVEVDVVQTISVQPCLAGDTERYNCFGNQVVVKAFEKDCSSFPSVAARERYAHSTSASSVSMTSGRSVKAPRAPQPGDVWGAR